MSDATFAYVAGLVLVLIGVSLGTGAAWLLQTDAVGVGLVFAAGGVFAWTMALPWLALAALRTMREDGDS